MNQQHHVDSNADITISCVAVGERSVESLSLLQVIFFLVLLVMETFVL
jgi:ADP-glucose pyrophosphorylase